MFEKCCCIHVSHHGWRRWPCVCVRVCHSRWGTAQSRWTLPRLRRATGRSQHGATDRHSKAQIGFEFLWLCVSVLGELASPPLVYFGQSASSTLILIVLISCPSHIRRWCTCVGNVDQCISCGAHPCHLGTLFNVLKKTEWLAT